MARMHHSGQRTSDFPMIEVRASQNTRVARFQADISRRPCVRILND
jgi:hypothetical protein